jgi:hypothetical protein
MDIIRGATRVVTDTANATTAAAGAVSGAAISGIIGGAQGTATGIRKGVSAGSHSTPAALLTLGAIGATGLVSWPVLLGVGGTALLVHQFSGNRGGEAKTGEAKTTAPASTSSRPRKAPAKSAAKTSRSRPRKATSARR